MKKLVFRENEFCAEKIIKTEKSIIFYINNEEVNRLQPISASDEYKVYNEDGTVSCFDEGCFATEMITTGTDLMRLIYAIMKENSILKAEITALKGGN